MPRGLPPTANRHGGLGQLTRFALTMTWLKQQNAEIVERARTAAGNLAHALKTPLTVMANAARSQESRLPALVSEQVDIARRQVELPRWKDPA